MVSLYKRLLFQTLSEEPNETTLTLSTTTNKGNYISLRPFLKCDSSQKFPFEWVFGGLSDSANIIVQDASTTEIDFNFQFDTNVYLNVPNTHRGEIQTFWKVWKSGCIEETGTVYPFGFNNPGVSFRELWQPLNPNEEDFVLLSDHNNTNITSITLYLNSDKYNGIVVIVGKWCQGILFKKNDGTIKGLSFVRLVQRSDGSWKKLIEFGDDFNKFPTKFDVKENQKIIIDGEVWDVIESNL